MLSLYRIGTYLFTLSIYGADQRRVAEVDRMLSGVLFAFRQGKMADDPEARRPDRAAVVDETGGGTLLCVCQRGPDHLIIRLADEVGPPASWEAMDYVYVLEPAIVNHAIRESPGHLWIHGACLYRNGKLTLLVADTGVGKTTLSLGLVGRGSRLLTDDIILFDLATLAAVPVPRCPHLRPSSTENLLAAGYDVIRQTRQIDSFVLLPEKLLFQQPVLVPVHAVYFLEARSLSGGSSEVLSLSDGLVRLAQYSNLLAVDSELDSARDLFAGSRFIVHHLGSLAHDLAIISGEALRV